MKKRTFWEVWSTRLPVEFSKKEAIETLQKHWGLSYGPTYTRLRGGHFPDMVNDISFLYQNFAIGFDMDQGFFFDYEKYDLIQRNQEMEDARMFNLAK